MSATVASLGLRKDTRIIGLISVAHAFSHFYQLTLPPLFPLLHEQLGYTFTELGTLIAVFYLVSGLVQPVAGFLVDRFGPRPVLYGGLLLTSGATALYGFASSYLGMLVLVVISGMGNGVFHPADYTVLSNKISEGRVGRGFSFHAFGGYIGYAVAPVLMIGAATLFGWQQATLFAGLVGLVYLGVLVLTGHGVIQVVHEKTNQGSPAMKDHAALLLSPIIIACFAFFCAIAMAQIGTQTFAPSALLHLFATPVTVSNAGVTVFLVAATGGILAGGVIADRASSHHLVAICCLIPPALLSLVPGWFELSPAGLWLVMGLAGLCLGLLIPSRDMLVRAVAPRTSSGKVFGVVYSGLDVGSAVTPIAFGWLVDRGLPAYVFVGIAACYLLGIVAIVWSRSTTIDRGDTGCGASRL